MGVVLFLSVKVTALQKPGASRPPFQKMPRPPTLLPPCAGPNSTCARWQGGARVIPGS